MSGVEFHPYDPAFAADPYSTYARLREESPIFYSPEYELTLFTKYHDISALLTDKRLGRSMDHLLTAKELVQKRSVEHWNRLPNYSRYVRVNLLETEGGDHTRLRRVLRAEINPRRVRALRDRTQGLVDKLVEELIDRRKMDFIEDLAVPLPVYMISELLGWPAEDRHRLRPWSADIVRLYEKDHSEEDELRAEAAAEEFAVALNDLIDKRWTDPEDDIVSALASLEGKDDTLSRDELIATCMLLLNAGHEATVNSAGNGLLALLRHPAQKTRLQHDPSLIKTAVEEMLRYDSPLHFFHRFVLEDMSFRDVQFSKGDTIGFLYGSANRDPEAFDNPDLFDITRYPNRHLAFGSGPHVCLGAPLARLELEILFSTLLRRIPDISLAEENPEYHTGLVFRGLKRLRVRW